jgi:hypothetical protein
MLSGQERRSLREIEQAELTRDPKFARTFDDGPRRHASRWHAVANAMQRATGWLGPVLIVVAAVITVPLMAIWPWFVFTGVALAAAGMVLSVGPAGRLLMRLWAKTTSRPVRP